MRNLYNKLKYKKEWHATSNSLEVKQGSIFFARQGKKVDGHLYIKDALNNGAEFIFYSSKKAAANFLPSKKFIFITDLEAKIPFIMKKIFTLPPKIIAITGTNGKTSTAFLSAQSFNLAGFKCGFIGTLGAIIFKEGKREEISPGHLTTPDIIDLYYLLSKMNQQKCEFVFFEASSIGIEQGRIMEIPLAAACFTNFTHDHLDYHKTLENYFAAKSLLFSKFLTKCGFAVINASDPSIFPCIKNICENKNIHTLTFSTARTNNFLPSVFLENYKVYPNKLIFDCNLFAKGELRLQGLFHIENIFCMLSLALGFGLSMEKFRKILPQLKAPPGRLEKINSVSKDAPDIFIDYAHTPDALLKAIDALNNIKEKTGKLFIIFGCGGDRDKPKRSIMGKIASENADFIIITDDNPRSESPALIRKDIISGLTTNSFYEALNREDAIHFALSKANKDDTVLIAGKGHEDYQIIGDTYFFFSDKAVAQKFLKSSIKKLEYEK